MDDLAALIVEVLKVVSDDRAIFCKPMDMLHRGGISELSKEMMNFQKRIEERSLNQCI
jgi:hypothetical protein